MAAVVIWEDFEGNREEERERIGEKKRVEEARASIILENCTHLSLAKLEYIIKIVYRWSYCFYPTHTKTQACIQQWLLLSKGKKPLPLVTSECHGQILGSAHQRTQLILLDTVNISLNFCTYIKCITEGMVYN